MRVTGYPAQPRAAMAKHMRNIMGGEIKGCRWG